MTIEKEIEAKFKINKEQYVAILDNDHHEVIIQKNFYYDTVDRALYNQGAVLRMRITGSRYQVTIKRKITTGEYEELNFNADTKKLPIDNENLYNQMKTLGVDVDDLKEIGKLKTTRNVFNFNGFLVEVDKSEYNGITDYEVEVEGQNIEDATRAAKAFLVQNNIGIHEPSQSKYRRFVETLKK